MCSLEGSFRTAFAGDVHHPNSPIQLSAKSCINLFIRAFLPKMARYISEITSLPEIIQIRLPKNTQASWAVPHSKAGCRKSQVTGEEKTKSARWSSVDARKPADSLSAKKDV